MRSNTSQSMGATKSMTSTKSFVETCRVLSASGCDSQEMISDFFGSLVGQAKGLDSFRGCGRPPAQMTHLHMAHSVNHIYAKSIYHLKRCRSISETGHLLHQGDPEAVRNVLTSMASGCALPPGASRIDREVMRAAENARSS